MVQRQQNVNEPVPPFFIRTLTSLENSLNAALAKEKEAKKKMNASNARALTAMKQKVKKVLKEFEKEVNAFITVRVFLVQYAALLTFRALQDSDAFEREYASFVQTDTPAAPKPKKVKKVEESEDDDFTTVGKGGKGMQFTPEGIFKNLQVVQDARGKKVSISLSVSSNVLMTCGTEY